MQSGRNIFGVFLGAVQLNRANCFWSIFCLDKARRVRLYSQAEGIICQGILALDEE